MDLLSNSSALSELMEQFYILSGIKMVIFDDHYNEIATYPEKDAETFCSFMRQNSEFDKQCIKCDRISFEKCRKTGKLSIYPCHAGLIEATAPLISDGKIVGYAMFGQITNIKGKELFRAKMINVCQNYLIPDNELIEKIKKIKFRTDKQISAASKILDACTNYILLKDMMTPPKQKLLEKIEVFIDEHISESISIKRICNEFYISKTRLYELVGKELKGGVASFIKQKRLSKAKKLLKETDMPIYDISASVGFSDYNYFIRSFREEYGITPNRYRAKKKNTNINRYADIL